MVGKMLYYSYIMKTYPEMIRNGFVLQQLRKTITRVVRNVVTTFGELIILEKYS